MNDRPVAVDDSSLVPRNGVATIPVLTNDSDIDGTLNTSSVAITAAPAHGSVVVLANGNVRYTPTANFSGDDEFRYTVRDNSNAVSNEATVTLRVNAAPVAVNDPLTTFINVPTIVDVLANDFDTDGVIEPGTLTIVKQPTRGSVSVTAAHKVLYTPNLGFTGNDTFTYTVKDNDGVTSNQATVSVAVIVNPLPWQNPLLHEDVNASGAVSPQDVLILIRDLNENGGRTLPNPPVPPFTPPPFLDPSGDNILSPLDVLTVIRYLNSQASGEGEAEGEAASGDLSGDSLTPRLPATSFSTLASASTPQTASTLEQSLESQLLGSLETDNAQPALPIGTAESVLQSALTDYLGNHHWEEA